jgi:K+-sensing histidine kinase KdpD
MNQNGEERKFLHDLSSPLAIAHGNLKILIRRLKSDEPLDTEEHNQRLDHALQACDRLARMISERRKRLIDSESAVDPSVAENN